LQSLPLQKDFLVFGTFTYTEKKTKKRQKFAIEKQPNPPRNRFVENYEAEEKEEAQKYELNYKTSMSQRTKKTGIT
jgi:hypothetical protein